MRIALGLLLTLLPWSGLPARDQLGDGVAFTAPIDLQTVDLKLLGRAVFAETNRVRRELGLKEFKSSDGANEAAAIQAHMLASQRTLSHENPLSGLRTVMDRARHAGLRPEMVAENVAVTPLLNLGDANQIGILRSEGEVKYINPATGEPAAAHTYESFARNLVARWMDSPGHRKNIVDPQFDVLGCASFPSKGASGADVVYSVQFFAAYRSISTPPLKTNRRK